MVPLHLLFAMWLTQLDMTHTSPHSGVFVGWDITSSQPTHPPRQMLELLVNAGSDINAQNIVGDAPLHKAALNGRARSADFLIRAGANVNIRNEFAQTPLHAACVSGNIEVVQRLVQGGADTSAQDAAEVRKEGAADRGGRRRRRREKVALRDAFFVFRFSFLVCRGGFFGV